MTPEQYEAAVTEADQALAANGRPMLRDWPKANRSKYPTGYGRTLGELTKPEIDLLISYHRRAAAESARRAIEAAMQAERAECDRILYQSQADYHLDQADSYAYPDDEKDEVREAEA